jgi:DNA-binding response OmpR family regulator
VTVQRTSPKPRLLVVDDDARYGQWLGHHVGVFCPDSTVAVLDHAGFERWRVTDPGGDCDIVLLSAAFGSSPEDPKARGLELLRQLRARPVFPVVIALAEEGNELTAVRALHLGAVDYLPKRLLTPERLSTSVRLALRRLEKRLQRKLVTPAHETNAPAPQDEQSDAPKLDSVAAADTWASMTIMPGMGPKPQRKPADSTGATREEDAPGAADSSSSKPIMASAPALSTPQAATATQEASLPPQNAISAAVPAPEQSTEAHSSPATTADDGAAAATQLMAPGQLEAILNSAAAASDDAMRSSAIGQSADEESSTDTSSRGTTANSKAARVTVSAAKRPTGTPPVTAEFIPGYIIKMKIGESEKAVVYLATSISLGGNVALKVSKTLRDDAAGRQFLEREYTAIIAIRDPLVVQIHDYGVHAGFEYLAMEYLVRGDLKTRMQAGLKESETLRYVEQIAAALRVVHTAGLLHRDLKPPNVMLRESDEVALIDFGLARALDGSTPSTRTGVLRGSPYYMSPEQAQGEQLDARSDFYSLGIIFYEMLTGRKPYTGATAMEVLQQHVNSPLPQLPHSLARYEPLLHRLTAKNRNERFTKAEEIIATVAELRAAMPMEVESAVA